jgi:cellulose synthase operon protein C
LNAGGGWDMLEKATSSVNIPSFFGTLVFFVQLSRVGLCLLIALATAVGAPADEAAARQAGKLLLRGKYAEAADLYRPLAGKEASAAVGLARCLASQGKESEAEKALTAFGGRHADVLAERAAMAFARGKVEDARKWAEEAIALDGDQLHARWTVAELDRTAGRLDDAERGCRWLVNYYNDHDKMTAESLRWIGLGAAQLARWTRQAEQFQFLINDLYPDAVKEEPDFWPAHYEAGLLFLEKHNRADAGVEFRAALEINPNAAEVHAAMALARIEEREIQKAEKSLTKALAINPRLLDGWLLKADLLWANFQTNKSLALLEEKALPLNPIYEDTLGRVAACYFLLDKPAKGSRFARLVEQVTRRNAHPGAFYYALAAQLEDRSKHVEAETYFREAIRVMPKQIGPEANLGLLYMRVGREDEAREALRGAFRADPFNVRVKNSLEVLDVLGSMRTVDSGQFTIKYSGQHDKLLARYAARHVAVVLPKLCEQFGYTPPCKTLIEIFNRTEGLSGHALFSARMMGLPYLGTIAASTGRIVAMASPNEQRARRQVNWARVLTHELVHVVTLQQTRFNCPHWYTEGLAVWSEQTRRPDAWRKLLKDRVAKGKLFNLDTLNFGFARPQSGDDWQLAYCQAELYVEYMLELSEKCASGKKGGGTPEARSVQGEDLLRQMLAAYTEGLDTPEAIRRVFGMSQAEFERGYTAFLKREAAKTSERTVKELQKVVKERPDDMAAAVALADADSDDLAIRKKLAQTAIRAKDFAAAEKWAREGMEIDVTDGDLHRVVAESAAKRHNYAEAVEEYETAVELKPDDLALRYALADALVHNKEPGKARDVLKGLLKRQADYPGAKEMLKTIGERP